MCRCVILLLNRKVVVAVVMAVVVVLTTLKLDDGWLALLTQNKQNMIRTHGNHNWSRYRNNDAAADDDERQ